MLHFIARAAVVGACALAAASARAQSLTWFWPANNANHRAVRAISPDGTVLVGETCCAIGGNGVGVACNALTGQITYVHGWDSMSDAVIVGASNGGTVLVWNNYHGAVEAMRLPGGYLGTLPGGGQGTPTEYSEATGVTPDGTVIVGRSNSSEGTRAFRWTANGGMVSLGVLPGTTWSFATAVSLDGLVIVGTSVVYSSNDPAGVLAFRWTQATGMVPLGTLQGGVGSWATAVNADGSVIVGNSNVNGSNRAFRWTAADGMQDLGTLGSDQTASATAVSGDGLTILGTSGTYGRFIWKSSIGIMDAGPYLRSRGIRTTGVFGIGGPEVVSADGLTFGGTGLGPGNPVDNDFYIATIPRCGSADFNCDGDTGTDADIEAFFACLAGNCPGAPCWASADFNGDGDSGTDADIEAFFRVLAGNPC
jgi:probable HAF family extracellular repeat protein